MAVPVAISGPTGIGPFQPCQKAHGGKFKLQSWQPPNMRSGNGCGSNNARVICSSLSLVHLLWGFSITIKTAV